MKETPTTPRPSVSLNWRNLNLRTKLIISLLLSALIPLAIITYISDNAQSEILTNGANATLENAAQLVADKLDAFVSNNLDVIRAEGQAPAIVDYTSLPESERAGSSEEARLNSFLQAISRQSPVYLNSVAILDLNGVTIADTNPSAIGLDRSNRYYFQTVLATNLPYASTLEYDTSTGRASLYFVAPIRSYNGDLIGILRKRFDAAILQDFVVSETGLAGEGSFAVLLDENYVRLAHGLNREILYKSIVPFDLVTLISLQSQRFMPPGTAEELSTNIPEFKAGLDNYEKSPYFTAELTLGGSELEQVAVVKTETQPWLVAFAIPQEVYLQPITAQRQTNVVTGITFAALISVFGVFLSQTLSGPIVRLTAVAEAIAGGDINVQAKVETGDEIGTLAKTFNRMTQQLRDFITSLEDRVAARTKDLATVAKISTNTATIRDPERMLETAVHLTQRGFNLYHAHVFTYHKDEDKLQIVACGYKEGDEHEGTHGTTSIPLSQEQSLVARAARTRKPVIVNDVRSDPGWLPNPLLPDTRAELAVPMIVGDELLGVLDVQADQVDAFSEESANIQMTLAAQIATTLQNAQSYTEAQSRAELETLVNTIGQKIQRAGSVEETLQTAVRELGTAIGAPRVKAVLSANPNSGNN